jgi:hypothetical protein
MRTSLLGRLLGGTAGRLRCPGPKHAPARPSRGRRIGPFAPLALLGAAIAVVAGAGSLSAHHAFSAEFDGSKPVTLKGTVTKMDWINPHCWIHMDVKGPDGKVVTWMVEGGAPNALLRRGFTKTSLPPGIEIVVEGFQAIDGANRANGRNLTFADGKKLFFGSSGTGAPRDGRDPTEPPR